MKVIFLQGLCWLVLLGGFVLFAAGVIWPALGLYWTYAVLAVVAGLVGLEVVDLMGEK